MTSPADKTDQDAIAAEAKTADGDDAEADHGLVKEFTNEIDDKVTTGRSRMRWFANHLILFVVGIVIAVPLQLFVFTNIEPEFFMLPLVAWVGILAIHANYAMSPILKRSSKKEHLQGIVTKRSEDDRRQRTERRIVEGDLAEEDRRTTEGRRTEAGRRQEKDDSPETG